MKKALQETEYKVPPHAIQAEQSVLGGLMLNNGAWDQIADRVGSGDFYLNTHRLLFAAIENLASNGKPFDIITLSDDLESSGLLDQAGGLAYLGQLANDTPSVSNITAYADIVRERSIMRQLLEATNSIADSVFQSSGKDSAQLLDTAETLIFDIAERHSNNQSGLVDATKVLTRVIDRIEELFDKDDAYTGLATGFVEIDKMTSGLQPSDLIIVAGRPSMGKTTFAINIAENVAQQHKKPVAIFSMEMPSESLVMKMLSSLGRIDLTNIRSGQLKDDEWPRLSSAVSLFSELKIAIDDTPALSPLELRARARRYCREIGDLGLIIIDYLQLMTVPGTAENRTNEVSMISRSLKALAKELKVPIIVLSQLNRSLEQRADRRPIMSDLRESGAIEQDADLVMFVYRDEYYNKESPDNKGMAEVIIGKHRNGPTGKADLAFFGQFSRFDNLAKIDSYDY